MARGDAEQFCLDTVKEAVLSKEICYACSVEDEHLIKKAFQTAIPNADASKFPDFIFDGGFIEHFEVTSSHSNRNGSTMKHEKSDLQKKANAKERALQERMDIEPCYEGETLITETWHSKHTHDDFCLSFQRNWKHHIESLDKYAGNKSVGIFMVQYTDSALACNLAIPDVKTELFYGDLLERRKSNEYRITYDTEILEFIYQSKDKIHYVAFLNIDRFHGIKCEIINVENIPEILKIVNEKYQFHCRAVGSAHICEGFSISNSINEDNVNEQR